MDSQPDHPRLRFASVLGHRRRRQFRIRLSDRSGNLKADGQPIQTGHYNGGTGTFTIGPMILNYGEKSGALAPGMNPTSESSSFPILPAVLNAGPHQLLSSYPGDDSFAASQSVPFSFTVEQAVSVLQDFFPVGTAVANAPLQLGAQIGSCSNGFAPFAARDITDITGLTPVVLGSALLDGSANGCDCAFVQAKFTTAGHHLLRLTYTGDSNVKGLTATPFVDVAANASCCHSQRRYTECTRRLCGYVDRVC